MAMANTQLTDTPWLDILPPPAPLDIGLSVTLAVIIISTLLLITLYKLWQRRPRQQALQQLHKLQQQLDKQSLDNKQCLYEIHRLLCLGLKIKRLSELKQEHLHQRLSELQYRAAAPETDETYSLLHEAQRIIRQSRL